MPRTLAGGAALIVIVLQALPTATSPPSPLASTLIRLDT
jgi:hypothetical protein